MATNSEKGSAVPTIIGMLLCSGLLCVGLNGVYTNWYKHYRMLNNSQNWTSNPCVVTTIKIEDTSWSKGKRLYAPTVEYTYTDNRFTGSTGHLALLELQANW